MAYQYQSSYCEAENEQFSYSSMGHMGYNAHNNHHGFGNGWGSNQMGGYSNYGQSNSGYGLGHHQGHGYHHNHHGSGGLASGYGMNQESSFYSTNNSCSDPCKMIF